MEKTDKSNPGYMNVPKGNSAKSAQYLDNLVGNGQTGPPSPVNQNLNPLRRNDADLATFHRIGPKHSHDVIHRHNKQLVIGLKVNGNGVFWMKKDFVVLPQW